MWRGPGTGALSRPAATGSRAWMPTTYSFPDKLERQIRCLRDHPDVKVLGAAGQYIDQRGRILAEAGMTGPFDEKDLQQYRDGKRPLYFIHSSVLMHRKTALDAGGYRVGFAQAEKTRTCGAGWRREGISFSRFPSHWSSAGSTGNRSRLRERGKTAFTNLGLFAAWRPVARGEAEPSFGEFVDWLDDRPWLSRVNARRILTGEMVYQKAALAYAGQRRMESLFYLLISMVIHPYHVIPRVYLPQNTSCREREFENESGSYETSTRYGERRLMRTEYQILLSCARTQLDTESREKIGNLLREGLDWPFLIRAALDLAVMPLFYHNLRGCFSELVPEAVLEELRALHQDHVARRPT